MYTNFVFGDSRWLLNNAKWRMKKLLRKYLPVKFDMLFQKSRKMPLFGKFVKNVKKYFFFHSTKMYLYTN